MPRRLKRLNNRLYLISPKKVSTSQHRRCLLASPASVLRFFRTVSCLEASSLKGFSYLIMRQADFYLLFL